MGCGNQTTTTTTSPPPAYVNAYKNVLGQAQNVASQPLQQYQGNIVQGFSPDQTQAFNTVDQAQGVAQPYLNQAQGFLNSATSPLWSGVQQFSPQAVDQYQSPYTQDVVNATQQQFNLQNAQQQQALGGSAAAAGAFGGDRQAVAQAALAGQQQTAQAPVIAGLENQGYSQALGEFNTQQQQQLSANEANAWLNSQAGFGEMNLAQEAQDLPLSAASAQLQTGALQQQLGQEQLNVPYEQFLQQQAYPFQTTGWLSNIAEGLGSSAGGTGTTTTPGASPISQLAGLGTTGLALDDLGAFDGLGSTLSDAASGVGSAASSAGSGIVDLLSSIGSIFNTGGAVKSNVIPFRKRDTGGMIPYQQIAVTPDVPDVNVGIIPQMATGTHGGMGMPHAPPAAQNNNAQSIQQLMQAMNLAKNSPSSSPQMVTPQNPSPSGLDSLQMQIPNLNFAPQKRGGFIRGYDDGGDIQPVNVTPEQNQFGITPPTPISYSPAKPDPNMALLAAGLGMLSGQSHNAFANIGEGGLAGLNEFQQEKQQNEKTALESSQVQEANQRGTLGYDEAVSKAREMADNLELTRENEKREQSNADRTFAQTQHNENAELALREKELDFNENPFGIMGGNAQNQNLHGDAYLGTLPESLQPTIKAIASGRQAPLSGYALTKPQGMFIMNAVNQYDPDYDATLMPMRLAARKDFASGVDGRTVGSFNTMLNHVEAIRPLISALQNGNIPAINQAQQWFSQQTGEAAPTNFGLAKQFLMDEAAKAVIGSRNAEQDRRHLQDALSRAGSPQQLGGALDVLQTYGGGQLDSLKRRYESSTKLKDFEDSFLSPLAKTAYDKYASSQSAFGGDASKLQAGHITSFSNGQSWTLGPDGQPERVH